MKEVHCKKRILNSEPGASLGSCGTKDLRNFTFSNLYFVFYLLSKATKSKPWVKNLNQVRDVPFAGSFRAIFPLVSRTHLNHSSILSEFHAEFHLWRKDERGAAPKIFLRFLRRAAPRRTALLSPETLYLRHTATRDGHSID